VRLNNPILVDSRHFIIQTNHYVFNVAIIRGVDILVSIVDRVVLESMEFYIETMIEETKESNLKDGDGVVVFHSEVVRLANDETEWALLKLAN
jgi:hypothetical protein